MGSLKSFLFFFLLTSNSVSALTSTPVGSDSIGSSLSTGKDSSGKSSRTYELIPLSNLHLTPSGVAQPGSEVENLVDGRRETDQDLFHTRWSGIPRQKLVIEADVAGQGRQLDRIVLYPRASGLNGIVREAEIHVQESGRWIRVARIKADLDNNPTEIWLDTPLKDVQRMRLSLLDSYGDQFSKKYMVSLGEVECQTVSDKVIRPSWVAEDADVFGPEGTSLKPGVDRERIARMRIPRLKELATRLFEGSYEAAAHKVTIQSRPSPAEVAARWHMGDGFSKYEGVTGLVLEEGDQYLFVGDTQGAAIQLLVPDWIRKPPVGIRPDRDPQGWGLRKETFRLKVGLNHVCLGKGGLAYLLIVPKAGSDFYPTVPVHFVDGRPNGWFDLTRGDDEEDFERLLAQAQGPVLDMLGRHVQLAFPVDSLRRLVPHRGVELVQTLDRFVALEKQFCGLDQEAERFPNRVLARVNYQYFLFRDGDGIAIVDGVLRSILDPDRMKTKESWGIAHELGHVFQMIPQMTWGGMTEVSNNILSMYVTTALGNKSRLSQEGRYAKAKAHILDQGISYLGFSGKEVHGANVYGEDGKSTDVFERLVPFWQLHLYFKSQGYAEFYPDLMKALRRQAPLSGGNRDNGYLDMLEFCRQACLVSHTDLTDFFERWGFFHVGTIHAVDYANSTYRVTQKDIDGWKADIKAMNLPVPTVDITTLED